MFPLFNMGTVQIHVECICSAVNIYFADERDDNTLLICKKVLVFLWSGVRDMPITCG